MRLNWRWGALGALGTLTALGVAMLGTAGCPTAISDYPPEQPCNPDAGLCKASGAAAGGVGPATGVGVGGGVSTTAGAGGLGGAAFANPLMGRVDDITSPDFTDVNMAPFTGVATVVAYPAATNEMYNATYNAGGTFDFTVLPNGPVWFLVVPTSTAVSTLWQAILPVTTNIVLPVVDQTMVNNIASQFQNVMSVSSQASTIVLQITKAGVPYAGVSVNGNPGSAVIVYDTASGVYSATATATGIAGTIILFNSTLMGTKAIALTDATMTAAEITVFAGEGAVTIAPFAWP